MSNPTPLKIKVLNSAKKEISVSKLSIIPTGNAEAVLKSPYEYAVANEFEFVLYIEENGMPPYRFPLESKTDGGGFTVKFQKSALSPAVIVKINRITPSDPSKAGVINVQVNIGNANEVILVAGWDYDGGNQNIVFPITRMRDLYVDKKIDNATLVTLYDFETGIKTQWIKGNDKIKVKNNSIKTGWCLLTSELQGSAAPNLTTLGSPGNDCISIVHVYDYIIEIGSKRPGILSEYSIFSHSYWGGPILLDTNERPDYQVGGAKQNERDPYDKDCRWKDFNSTNMPDISKFKAAFTSNPIIKMWGCLAITSYNRMIYKARKAASDSQKLNIPPDDRTSTNSGTIFPDTRLGVDSYLKDSAFKDNFMYQMSQSLGIPVWGGGPGMGASYLRSSSWYWMYIAEYVVSISGGKRVNGKVYYKGNMDYLRNRHSRIFDADGYMKYE